MLKTLKSKKIQALAIGVTAVLLMAFFFRGTDFSALMDAIASANLRLIVLAGSVIMASYVLRAIRWRVLLAPIGKPSLVACFVTTVIGFMVNFLAPTGRLGELVRPYLLARREGFSASSTFATIFLERVLDLMTVVFLVGTWLLLGSPPEGAKSQGLFGRSRWGDSRCFWVPRWDLPSCSLSFGTANGRWIRHDPLLLGFRINSRRLRYVS